MLNELLDVAKPLQLNGLGFLPPVLSVLGIGNSAKLKVGSLLILAVLVGLKVKLGVNGDGNDSYNLSKVLR